MTPLEHAARILALKECIVLDVIDLFASADRATASLERFAPLLQCVALDMLPDESPRPSDFK